jgi:hypothetical protein
VVECDLAKVEVAGSNPVSRSNPPPLADASFGGMNFTLLRTRHEPANAGFFVASGWRT